MSGPVRFIYKNSRGEISEQSLTTCADKGIHFSGYSETHGMVRTFRKDRVQQWLAGDYAALQAPRKAGALSVLFTGFGATERARLEAQAQAEGMRIRKTVSETLDFLCTGPNAGPRKLDQAEQCSVEILTPEAFENLIDTGELPAASDDLAPAPPEPERKKKPTRKQRDEVADYTAARNNDELARDQAETEQRRPKKNRRPQTKGQRRWHWPSFVWGVVAGWVTLIALALMSAP